MLGPQGFSKGDGSLTLTVSQRHFSKTQGDKSPAAALPGQQGNVRGIKGQSGGAGPYDLTGTSLGSFACSAFFTGLLLA